MAKAEQRKTSPVNDKMVEGVGVNPMGYDAEAPGTANRVHIKDLGFLDEFPDPPMSDDPEEGTGPWVVILAHFMTGAGEHDGFVRGDVRRLSRIIPGYDKENKDTDIVKGRIKRFFSVKAVRMATRDEWNKGHLELTLESESKDVQAERDRRIHLEQENEILRRRIMDIEAARINATPGEAGASDAAQAAVGADQIPPTGDENPQSWE